MGTALIAAAAALATVVCVWLLAAGMRVRADRRFEAALARIDEHMGAIVEHVRRVGDRAAAPESARPSPIEPTLDLDPLIERIAQEACARAGADASIVHVEGPAGVSARRSFGDPPEHELLHGPLGVAAEVYRAVTIDWSPSPADAERQRLFASAVVVPLGAEGETRGAIAVYGIGAEAFRHEEVRALEELAREASPAVVSAARIAAVESRATIDEATGVRNERAYEEELDREVARSRRSGRTFALLVVEVRAEGDGSPSVGEDECLWEFAGLAVEATRSTDVVCRRGGSRFAVLLPETDARGARHVLSRLETDLATRSFRACAPTISSAAVVEWAPGESAVALDARVRGAASSTTGGAAVRSVRSAEGPVRLAARAPDARDDFLVRLAAEIARARVDSRELTLLLLEPVGHLRANGTRTNADGALSQLAARVDEALGSRGGACSRTGRNQLGVALTGATVHDMERHFAELRDWLQAARDDAVLAGGVTVVSAADRADTMFGRAEHALWQAKQAGESTVVVAPASDRTGP